MSIDAVAAGLPYLHVASGSIICQLLQNSSLISSVVQIKAAQNNVWHSAIATLIWLQRRSPVRRVFYRVTNVYACLHMV